MTAQQHTIECMMQVPRHTCCRIDAGFGVIKQVFRLSDCDTLTQLEDGLNKSADTTEAACYPVWL